MISVFLFYLSVFANLSTVDVLYDEESECRRWNYSMEKERDPRGPSSLAQSVYCASRPPGILGVSTRLCGAWYPTAMCVSSSLRAAVARGLLW